MFRPPWTQPQSFNQVTFHESGAAPESGHKGRARQSRHEACAGLTCRLQTEVLSLTSPDSSSEALSSTPPFSVLSFLTSKCPHFRGAASLAALNPYSFPFALGPLRPVTREPECSVNYTNLSPSLSCREAWDGVLLLLENPRSQYGTTTW